MTETDIELEGIRHRLKFAAEADALTVDAVRSELKILMRRVTAIKREGISMWNYKGAIPKIFDIVDGSFEIINNLAVIVEENKNRIDALEKPKEK